MVLGWATADDRSAFDAVQASGGGDAESLAGRLAWSTGHCLDTLVGLARRRLVRAAPRAFLPLVSP